MTGRDCMDFNTKEILDIKEKMSIIILDKERRYKTMTVKELIKIIRKFPNDAEVFYLDTWWESEGYGDNADNSAWNPIEHIKYNAEDNTIELI